MVTSRELAIKKKIVDVIQRMPENSTIDDAIYRLGVLKATCDGLMDVEEGRTVDHDELFDELLKGDEEPSNQVERPGQSRPTRAKATHHKGRHSKKGA